MMYDIKSDEMVGKVQSDLVPNNQIDGVDWSNSNVRISYNYTMGANVGFCSADDGSTLFATELISSSDPLAAYDGVIETTKLGDIVFLDIITPKNTKYYKVIWVAEPYAVLSEISKDGEGGPIQTGGPMLQFDSFENFKQLVLKDISAHFTHIAGYIDDADHPMNEKLSETHVVLAVRLTGRDFQVFLGCPADQYTIVRENVEQQKGGNNGYSIMSNELFARDTLLGEQSIGEAIADSIISAYKNGRQIMQFSVVANDKKWYKVGDIVTPYGFNGQPLARKRDGTAKRFMITSSEFVYKGSIRQNLSMIEEV